MAFSLIAHKLAAGVSPDTATTAAMDSTGANLLIGMGGFFGTSETFTDSKSNTWNALTIRHSGHGQSAQIWWCKPTSVGSGHTATLSGTGTYPACHFMAFSGAHATSPFDTENGAFLDNNGHTSAQPGSVTPAQNGSLIVAALVNNDAVLNGTINSGFTLVDSVVGAANNYSSYFGYLIQSTAAAVNPTWSNLDGAVNGEALVIAAFTPAAGGGGSAVGARLVDGLLERPSLLGV